MGKPRVPPEVAIDYHHCSREDPWEDTIPFQNSGRAEGIRKRNMMDPRRGFQNCRHAGGIGSFSVEENGNMLEMQVFTMASLLLY
jgi:hypothetical protein